MDAPINMDRLGDVTVIKFTTPALLDALTLKVVSDELERVINELGRCRLLIDFSTVRSMSSSTIGLFLNIHHLIQNAKGQLVFCNMNKTLMESFKIAKLDKMFEFQKDQTSALKVFRAS